MNSAFLLVFILFWSGLTLAFDGFAVRGVCKQYVSRNYPVVSGTITRSKVNTHHGSKGGTSYSADIEYKYLVDGQAFTGKKVRLGITSSSHASATGTVNAHPVGSSTQVYYNPANPQEALLTPGATGADFMMFLFLTPFNMVMLGLWLWLGGWMREHFFRPPAGGVKIINAGQSTRIRLPRFAAAAWGIGVTGGLGFVSIFAVGFSTNMEPPLSLALLVIAVAYAAGFFVYAWQRAKINSGIDDLVFDEFSQSLELPLTFGRTARVTAHITDIECLNVETIIHRSNKGGISYTYAPTLRLRGHSAVQKLADWSDKLKAEEFAAWLRQRLGGNIPAVATAPPAWTPSRDI